MFDVTFIIPEYDEPHEPVNPNDEMPNSERERLFDELCELIDAGVFDPEREILI